MKLLPDNPVWDALNSHQNRFNQGADEIKYFPANVSPFLGLQHWDEKDMALVQEKLPAGRYFSVMINKQVKLPGHFEILFTCPLYQMICPWMPASSFPDNLVRPLGYEDVPAMLELTGKTKPGPFLEKTIEMGNYFGIFENRSLVAMAGERLKMEGYTEISAICTDPGYRGKGLAKILTAFVSQQVFAGGNTPFLHVKTDNDPAIQVYRSVGFEIRTEVFFAIFRINTGVLR